MKLIVQPHDARVGELLVEDLRSKRYHTFLFCAAYAKLSGVSALDDALREFTSNGGATYASVGIDQRGTSYEALRALMELSAELYVVHNRSQASTFHLKAYILAGDTCGKLYVGSNNLTGGGLYTNYETALCQEFDLTQLPVAQEFVDMVNTLKRFLQEGPCCKRATPDLLQTLYDHRLVSTESELHAARQGVSVEREDSVFGLELFQGSGARPNFAPLARPQREEVPVQDGGIADEDGDAEGDEGPVKRFYKRLSANDVDKKSSPGQIIIPIAFKGFFDPLSEPQRTRVGAMQSERYFNLLYENTDEVVENARVIFYEPAPGHKRKNSEVRFALRNRGIFDAFGKDDVLVFTQAPRGDQGRYLCTMEWVSVDSPEMDRYPGRFGWIQQ